jgi:redox-sensitive bicupin YhaK (pirin superfamily)
MIMNRKSFLKKSILGFSLLSVGGVLSSFKKENTKIRNIIGFNHLPNTKSQIMKNAVYHAANTRGKADHGWLKANHSFSFANYYNPERMQFGALRVLNDDFIEGGAGFGTHPHDNMEIITIPLEGDLEHKDNMGNQGVIASGEVQVMSAGTGIYHSEYNHNKDKHAKLLQIWVFPNQNNVKPRYEQMKFDMAKAKNQWMQLVSPSPEDDGLWIYQNAWFSQTKLDKDVSLNYTMKAKNNGAYIFVIEGAVQIGNQILNQRDGYGIWDIDQFEIIALQENANVLVMDVPYKDA